MQIEAEMTVTTDVVKLVFNNKQGELYIHHNFKYNQAVSGLYLNFKNRKLQSASLQPADHGTIIQLLPPKNINQNELLENIQETISNKKLTPVGDNQNLIGYVEKIMLILDQFMYPLIPKTKTFKKTQHRWKKSIADVTLMVDAFDSKATIFWQKRNEMRIVKGATLRTKYPLNKDGSIGLDARMGTQLRQEQASKVEKFTTTEDIILKSVNEVGLFLYFGGTNSWLVLKDVTNKTIDEYAIVK
ncbi:hypothetical protein GZH44_09005 [Weissella hellenica]|nr:hypothetical protein GZH44_09005 [Weissella hellenica]